MFQTTNQFRGSTVGQDHEDATLEACLTSILQEIRQTNGRHRGIDFGQHASTDLNSSLSEAILAHILAGSYSLYHPFPWYSMVCP